ncbi:MAG: nucleotidyltransferase domain-containing protein [Rhodothermaceae bacterium]|nr:nucleotidyltransferase domain-containing protein [Rhodothermaceae bacterium]
MTVQSKSLLKDKIIDCLKAEEEIERIVFFGSFMVADEPHDIDVAIFQDSNHSYLDLAMKYRKLTREVSKEIPLDIIPLKSDTPDFAFLTEIEKGVVVYER